MRSVITISFLVAAALAACGGDAVTDGGGGNGGTAGSGAGGGNGGTGGTASSSSTSGQAGYGGAGGASPSWQECFGVDGQHVQYGLSLCTGNTCQMVEHQIDCCGNIMFVGIEANAMADFEICEAAWRATLPLCDCPIGDPQVQQPYGQTVSGAEAADVGCINWTSEGGICMTTPK